MPKIITNAIPIMPDVQLTCTGCQSVCEYDGNDGQYLVNPSCMKVWMVTCPLCGERMRYPNISFYDLYHRRRDGSFLPGGGWDYGGHN